MLKFHTIVLVVLLVWCNNRVGAQSYPADFAQVLVTNGIANPTAMAFAPDGRIFVAQQAGRLRVIKNNTLLPTSFVQLTVNATGERGLIGIALDPDFVLNNYIYLYYTVPGTPAHNRISRFTANGDIAQADSEVIILELDPLSNATNHNGGAMHFGLDGKLYVAIGENANSAHAQNLDTYHGKLLRINKDGSVPGGNPFPTGSEQRKRVWAYGLRNPYTFSIHPETGRILVNDVGQVTWEEINDATTGGKNFGWPTTEGKFNAASFPNLTNPIYAYPHGGGDGKGCAITGGTFFYPSNTNYPAEYFGKYFFQDLCNRWINTLDVMATTTTRFSFATSIGGNSLALSVGPDGNLYYLSRSSSALYKIIYNRATSPYIISHPVSLTTAEGQSAIFSVNALGSTPFNYQWQKDGIDIQGAVNDSLIIENALLENQGEYTVTVSNAAGVSTSNAATLTVIENALPVAEILTPMLGATYVAGTEIEFAGVGNDAEDGPLQATAFHWEINFHHGTHQHDQPAIEGVKNGAFVIPNEGETSDDVWYRVILTVTDSKGMVGKDSVDIFPKKSIITLTTDPPGLEVLVDGQASATPLEISSVEGLLRTLSVNTPQQLNNVGYEFASWSNGGEITQVLATPAEDLSLIANFSIIVAVESDPEPGDVVLYPNPSKMGWVVITLSAKGNQGVTIQLVNLLSQVVATQEQHLTHEENHIRFNYGKQARGIYSVVVKAKDKTIVKKLLIPEN
ncbi:PQQ-dependent sugar dehydrogenase [Chryseolinea sp. H1M3-3]|uniref:PQQ-dependent sugar dehydrogenase n=1 Tax=Chryseolinea sp. H1M3-3 TaxID=3034144 RepID=UPI0023EB5199|nr:PQQ-dependent sugar dehydrogenase [Chryseolinea sp. H1M3-3]